MYTIFILIFSAAALLATDYREMLNKGDAAYKNFDNVKAVEFYEKAYASAPEDFDVLLRITKGYNAVGDELVGRRERDKAEPYIQKAVQFSELFNKKFPNSAESHAYLAMAYGNQAMFLGNRDRIKLAKQIEEHAKTAIKMDPNLFLPYVILGIYYRELAALSWLERAFANTFFGSVPKGSNEDSERMLLKALQLDPGAMIAAFNISRTYRAMDNENKEREYLQKAVNMKIRDFRDKYTLPRAKRRLEELK